MTKLDFIKSPVEIDLLVSFFDLTNFVKISSGRRNLELFEIISDYYNVAGKIIGDAGGRIIKFIGDAGLAVFPEDKIDAGINALALLQKETEALFAKRNLKTRLIVKAHFGQVACGPIESGSDKRLDIIGETVNLTAMLASKDFAISQKAFEKLSAETKKTFKKHIPPVTYTRSN